MYTYRRLLAHFSPALVESAGGTEPNQLVDTDRHALEAHHERHARAQRLEAGVEETLVAVSSVIRQHLRRAKRVAKKGGVSMELERW